MFFLCLFLLYFDLFYISLSHCYDTYYQIIDRLQNLGQDLSYSMNVFEPSILDSIIFLDHIHRPGVRDMHLAYDSYPETWIQNSKSRDMDPNL